MDASRLDMPRPDRVTTPAELIATMHALRDWAALTYRQLEVRALALGERLPRSTISNALSRGRMPRESTLASFVRACGGDGKAVETWLAARRRIAVPEAEEQQPEEVVDNGLADAVQAWLTNKPATRQSPARPKRQKNSPALDVVLRDASAMLERVMGPAPVPAKPEPPTAKPSLIEAAEQAAARLAAMTAATPVTAEPVAIEPLAAEPVLVVESAPLLSVVDGVDNVSETTMDASAGAAVVTPPLETSPLQASTMEAFSLPEAVSDARQVSLTDTGVRAGLALGSAMVDRTLTDSAVREGLALGGAMVDRMLTDTAVREGLSLGANPSDSYIFGDFSGEDGEHTETHWGTSTQSRLARAAQESTRDRWIGVHRRVNPNGPLGLRKLARRLRPEKPSFTESHVLKAITPTE